MMETEFLRLTKELQSIIDRSEQIYRESREKELTHDFHTVIKPYADYIKDYADRWLILADQWLKASSPKYVNGMQIKETHRNILQVSVHCHIPESSKSKFIKHCKSVRYVLRQIELESNANEHGGNGF